MGDSGIDSEYSSYGEYIMKVSNYIISVVKRDIDSRVSKDYSR